MVEMQFGHAQFTLLSGIIATRRSKQVRKRLAELAAEIWTAGADTSDANESAKGPASNT